MACGAVEGAGGGIGFVVGAFIGGALLGMVPTTVLLPLLAAILLVAAARVWRH